MLNIYRMHVKRLRVARVLRARSVGVTLPKRRRRDSAAQQVDRNFGTHALPNGLE